MKKSFLFSAFVLILSLNSCSQLEKNNPMESLVTTDNQPVPETVVQSVSSLYPTAQSITYTTIKSNAIYGASVVLNSKIGSTTNSVVVEKNGKIRENYTQIKQNELPTAALTYLDTNYPNYTFIRASMDTVSANTSYHVHIAYNSNEYSLLFDQNGAVTSEFTLPKRGERGPGGKGDKGFEGGMPPFVIDSVALADIPAAVIAAIDGYHFIRASVVTDSQGAKIYHILADKDSTVYKFLINELGTIIDSKSKENGEFGNGYARGRGHNKNGEHAQDGGQLDSLAQQDIPAAITTYLNTNYSGWIFESARKKSKDGNLVGIGIVFSLNDKKYLIIFDNNYAFKELKRL